MIPQNKYAPWLRYFIRDCGAGQRVRGPTLTTKFEKWISRVWAFPQENFHILEAVR